MTFSNHFAAVSNQYATARPTYPDELFAWLANHTPAREFAWGCACGSGQATLDLARYFAKVVGTDASAEQLAGAPVHPDIEWRKAPAEQSGLADASVDLVVVAQAFHWFDQPRFVDEALRVLKPGGILAVWSYGLMLSTAKGSAA
jgi:ubiquinone/menaquinone biosynthesis C-methylase UbiE